MTVIRERNLSFTFSESAFVIKHDKWGPYLEWSGAAGGRKGVDFAMSHDKTLWLLEVKDFRVQGGQSNPENSSRLAKTVHDKVVDTLSCLALVAKSGDTTAVRLLAPNRRSVVLHLEPPIGARRLFPTSQQSANIRQRLRQLLRKMAPNPRVLSIATTAGEAVPWTVCSVGPPAGV